MAVNNEALPVFDEDADLKRIVELFGLGSYERAVFNRGLSFIEGALLIVENSTFDPESQKGEIIKEINIIKAQWKKFAESGEYNKQSILALQKTLKKVLKSNVPEFKNKSGKKKFQKTKALMHAESFVNLKKREKEVSYIKYKDPFYQKRIDTPITAFTVGQTSEWLAILEEEKYRPKWFTKLAEWEQNYLRKKVNEWVDGGKKGNLGDYLGVFPTTVRAYPGARNGYTSTFITYELTTEGRREISRTVKVRSGHVAPMEMSDKRERLEATKENIKQLMLANIKEQLANGNTDILICLQTLISPVGFSAFGKKLGVEDYKMNLVRMQAVKEIQETFGGESEKNKTNFRAFLLSNNIELKEGQRPKLTLISSNHAVNMGRFFKPWKNQENQNTFEQLYKRAEAASSKALTTKEKALAALKKIHEINGNSGRISRLRNFFKFGMNHNAERAALEQIAVDALGGVRIGSCKSGKDREGAVSMHMAAMLLYYDSHNNTFPPVPRVGKSLTDDDKRNRADYERLVAEQLLIGHDTVIANKNASGSLGIKDVGAFLGTNVLKQAEMRIEERTGFKNDMSAKVIAQRSDKAASLNKLSGRAWYNPKKFVESIKVSRISKKLRKITVPIVESQSASPAEEKVTQDHKVTQDQEIAENLRSATAIYQSHSLDEEPEEPLEEPPLPPDSFKLFLPDVDENNPGVILRRRGRKYGNGEIAGSYLNVEDSSNASELKLQVYLRGEQYQETVANIIINKLREKDPSDKIYKYIQESSYGQMIDILDEYLQKIEARGTIGEQGRLALYKLFQNVEKNCGVAIVEELSKLPPDKKLKLIQVNHKYEAKLSGKLLRKKHKGKKVKRTAKTKNVSSAVNEGVGVSERKAAEHIEGESGSEMIKRLKIALELQYIRLGSLQSRVNQEKQIQIKNLIERSFQLQPLEDALITPIAWLEMQTRILKAIQEDLLNSNIQKNDPVLKSISEMIKNIRNERVHFLENNSEELNRSAGSKNFEKDAKEYLAGSFLELSDAKLDKEDKGLLYEKKILQSALSRTSPFPGFVEYRDPPTSGKQEKAEFTGFYIDENGKKWMIKMSKEHQPDNYAEVVTSSLLGGTVSNDYSVPYKFIKSRNNDLYIMSEVRNEFKELSRVLQENNVDISMRTGWMGSNPKTDENKKKIHNVIIAQGPACKKQMATILAGCLLANDVDCQIGNICFYKDETGQQKMAKFDDGWGLADIGRDEHAHVNLFESLKFYGSKGDHKHEALPTNHFLDYPHILYSKEFVMSLHEVSINMLAGSESLAEQALKNIDDSLIRPVFQSGEIITSRDIEERNKKALKEGYILLARHLSINLSQTESDLNNVHDALEVREKIKKKLAEQLTNRARSMQLLSISLDMKLIIDGMEGMDKNLNEYKVMQKELQDKLVLLFQTYQQWYPNQPINRKNIIPKFQDAPLPFKKTKSRREFLEKILALSEMDMNTNPKMREFYDKLRVKDSKNEIKENKEGNDEYGLPRSTSSETLSASTIIQNVPATPVVSPAPNETRLSARLSPASLHEPRPPVSPMFDTARGATSPTALSNETLELSTTDLKCFNDDSEMQKFAKLELENNLPKLSGQNPVKALSRCEKFANNENLKQLAQLTYTLRINSTVPSLALAITQAKHCLEEPIGKQVTILKIGDITYKGEALIQFKKDNQINTVDTPPRRSTSGGPST